jgi:N-acetylmuramoyl-L-alanine amidase
MPLKSKLSNIVVLLLMLVLPLHVCAQEVGDALRIKTVVIDPGHGGKDPGAITKNGKYKEKDITLSVALKLGNMIKSKYPDIKVIYTRSTDKYVELSQRAAIANRNRADLFISIHVNSAKATQARGTETFVMGAHKSEDNFEVCKTENSVIVIEDDYQTKYAGFDPNSPESYIIFSLLQNMHQEQSIKYAAHVQGQFAKGPITVNRGVKQGGLLVLWKTTMPAVLTELGFISNPKDCSVLVSRSGQEQFAGKLFNAFEAYMKEVEKGAQSALQQPQSQQNQGVSNAVQESQGDVKQQGSESAEEEFYAVQILSVAKQLPKGAYDLRGRKDAKFIKAGNLYKYYIGGFSSRQEAAAELARLRKSFPGAFVIHIKGNKIVK